MPNIRELRQQQMSQPDERSGGFVTTALIGVVAFIVGALAIMAWPLLTSFKSQPVETASEQPAPTFAGKRIGRAGTAPLLRLCMRGETFSLLEGADPDAFLALLNAHSTASRLAPLIGGKVSGGTQFTEFWGEIADCVYRQNSRALCDADNRALAAEAATGFIRQSARIIATPPSTPDDHAILTNVSNIRERVLDSLRARLQNGYLIAADFGPLPPADIKKLLVAAKPATNPCDQ